MKPIIVGTVSGLGAFATVWMASWWLERPTPIIHPTPAISQAETVVVAVTTSIVPKSAASVTVEPSSKLSNSNSAKQSAVDPIVQQHDTTVVAVIDECQTEIVPPITTTAQTLPSATTGATVLNPDPVFTNASSPAVDADLVVSSVGPSTKVVAVVAATPVVATAPVVAKVPIVAEVPVNVATPVVANTPQIAAVVARTEVPVVASSVERRTASKIRLNVPASLPQVDLAASAAKHSSVDQGTKRGVVRSAVTVPSSQTAAVPKNTDPPPSLSLASDSIRRLTKKLGGHVVH